MELKFSLFIYVLCVPRELNHREYMCGNPETLAGSTSFFMSWVSQFFTKKQQKYVL